MQKPMTRSSSTTLLAHDDCTIKSIVAAIRNGIREDYCAPDMRGRAANNLIKDKVSAAISNDEQPGWEYDVLESLVDANAKVNEPRSFVAVISTVVLFVWELIQQRNSILIASDEEFIAYAFDKYLTRDDILLAIEDAVGAETEELLSCDDEFTTLNALFALEAQLTEALARSDTKRASVLGCSVESARGTDPVELQQLAPTATSVTTPRPQTACFRDVHLQYFLNPGCTMEIDRVTSIEIRNDNLMLETSVGYRVLIAENVTVSERKGPSNTVEVRAPTADGFNLSAIVIIPPGLTYIINDASSVDEENELPDWTDISTPKATIWVGNGPYVLDRQGKVVVVTNVYH